MTRLDCSSKSAWRKTGASIRVHRLFAAFAIFAGSGLSQGTLLAQARWL